MKRLIPIFLILLLMSVPAYADKKYSKEHIEKQKKALDELSKMWKARKALGVSGDHCIKENETSASICVEVAKADFDCNESLLGNYYDYCDASLIYNVETDYTGELDIDVGIKCKVTIKYEERNKFSLGGSVSGSEENSHKLTAYSDSFGNEMEYTLRFSLMAEPYKVKISSAKCEIESVKMN